MDIGFIGTGNMGSALIKGYSKSNPDGSILIYDKDPKQTEKNKDLRHIKVIESLDELIKLSHIIILAVKPNIFDTLLDDIKEVMKSLTDPSDKVIVSIAAGISIDYIKKKLVAPTKVVRTMPNLNSMVGRGMTGVSRDDLVGDDEFHKVIEIFDSVGKTKTVSEKMMDTVVGISGSSPAYTFMYMDALVQCAVKNGMDKKDALFFASNATLGAAVTVMESGLDPKTLVENVCSPGGTTIEAVNTLNELGFSDIVEKAMTAAVQKSKLMTK